MLRKFKASVCFSVLLFSHGVLAQDMSSMIKQQMETAFLQMCNDPAYLSCLKVGSNKCITALKKSLSSCDHLFPKGNAAMGGDEAFMAHGDCMEKKVPGLIGASIEKLDSCEQQAMGMSPGGAMPMDSNQGVAMMTEALQQHAQSIGTDQVTLPVYKNATLMSHIADEHNLEIQAEMLGVKPLPALMLASPDNMKTIADYYRNKLKNYREYHNNGEILFMEKGPDKFDYSMDMRSYVTTPHVLIMPLGDTPGAPSGSRSRIEIAYRH